MCRRFTLVELMIVVAIIAILAALAIPLLATAQLKAKLAEVPPNLDGIMTAIAAYAAAQDAFPSTALAPLGLPGKTPRTWTTATAFQTIGWAPDGNVRATYYLMSFYAITDCSDFELCTPGQPCAGSLTDIDGDSRRQCGYRGSSTDPLVWGAPVDTY